MRGAPTRGRRRRGALAAVAKARGRSVGVSTMMAVGSQRVRHQRTVRSPTRRQQQRARHRQQRGSRDDGQAPGAQAGQISGAWPSSRWTWTQTRTLTPSTASSHASCPALPPPATPFQTPRSALTRLPPPRTPRRPSLRRRATALARATPS